MINNLHKKIKKNLNFNKKNLIEQPLKALKKFDIKKLTKITVLKISDTFKNLKIKSKQKELVRIKLLEKEKINKIKKEKLEIKKKKIAEINQIKKDTLNRLIEEKKI